jgi:hypothetical protein
VEDGVGHQLGEQQGDDLDDLLVACRRQMLTGEPPGVRRALRLGEELEAQ